MQRDLSRCVREAEGSLSVRLQYAERRGRRQHRRGNRPQPRALGLFESRRGQGRAGNEPALRRIQPRHHAPDLHQRPGDLRVLVVGAAGTGRGQRADPLLPERTGRGIGQRPGQPDAAQALRRELDDRRQRPERFRCPRANARRGLPVSRRSQIGGAESRGRPPPARARCRRGADAVRAHRKIRGQPDRSIAIDAGRRSARQDCSRRAGARALPRLRPQHRPAGSARADDQAGEHARLAVAG